jgi:hypothetical protein
LVFVALAACAFAINDIVQEDQAAAEQSYRIHGFYPSSWYSYMMAAQYYHINGVYPSWYQYGVNAGRDLNKNRFPGWLFG